MFLLSLLMRGWPSGCPYVFNLTWFCDRNPEEQWKTERARNCDIVYEVKMPDLFLHGRPNVFFILIELQASNLAHVFFLFIKV